jgi:transcriptional regulator with GAF, ATPase, and Fis domain
VEQIAPTDTTVLILGETGVGKELFARAVHERSSRKARPLVKVNCAALPPNLIESELFGHEKGAFSGAHARQVGRFELANGSTVFLDEIGEFPLELQAKLLRVLQDGEFERLGNPRTVKSDVRIIAATNKNLEEEIRKGRFRQDLWYRLNGFPMTVPPLRERKDDIPVLVDFFVDKYGKKVGRSIKTIPTNAMKALREYSWPGNVRELENVIERSVVLSQSSTLKTDLPEDLNPSAYRDATLEDVERKHIRKVLKRTGGRIRGNKGAAEILGLKPTTLASRMKKLGIDRQGHSNEI